MCAPQAAARRRFRIGAGEQQALDQLPPLERMRKVRRLSGKVKRCRSGEARARELWVGLGFEQRQSDGDMPARRCPVERGRAFHASQTGTGSVDVAAAAQAGPDHTEVPLRRRFRQRSARRKLVQQAVAALADIVPAGSTAPQHSLS